MGEIISSFPVKGPKTNNWTLFESLSVGLICLFTIWFIQYLWSRRRLYECARKVQGPFALPFIGCSYLFVGSPNDIFGNIMWILNNYPGLSRIWHGNRLFYGITIPEHLEIVSTSQKALAKEALYKYAEPAVGHGIFTAPVSKWKKNRRLIMPTFNPRILDSFVEVFAEQAEIFATVIKPLAGKGEVDLFELMTRCTLDIICETAMGIKVQAQTTENVFGHCVDNFMEIVFLRMFVIMYHFDFIFNLTHHKRDSDRCLKYMKEFTGKVIKKKMEDYELESSNQVAQIEDGKKRKAFLDYLLDIQGSSKFSFEELQDEVHTFMIAGSDTTASSNCFIMTILGLYPEIQQKVYDEVIEVLGPHRRIEPADINKLQYLDRVIKETLRVFPVAAFVVRAIDGDIDLKDGDVLPAGSSAVLGILHTHRSARYWPDPLKFDPDRFLPEEVAKRHPCSYIPFSYGPRNCIGPRYASMALKSVVATIVREYTVKTGYKSIEEIEIKSNLVSRPVDGFKVSFEAR